MIYPNEFPSETGNKQEQFVFKQLSQLSDIYDIFYSRKFIGFGPNERNEYEADFIICIPNRAVICLEVKGGIIKYDGISGAWSQNSAKLYPSPDTQASSIAHSLINRYGYLSSNIPIGWVLCFPDCEVPQGAELPPLLSIDKIIDQQALLYLDSALNSIFQSLLKQFPEKKSSRHWQYEKFKTDLLRGIGFVQVLGTRVKHDDEKFIQLADDQIDIFKHVIENDKIIVNGPAGSGKTIVAKTLAQEAADSGKKVFFTCFNRTLANKLAYETGIRDNELISVNTFHSYAKRTIEALDHEWWTNAKSSDEDFWDIEVPAKLDSLLQAEAAYDFLIIDEGQDFKEFWFELLFRLVKKDGKIIIFLDKMQDIFTRDVAIPNSSLFFKYTLKENCRNTKKIVQYLELVVNEPIPTRNNPVGEDITVRNCKNSLDIQKQLIYDIQELLKDHRISTEQILILMNSEKSTSSIAELKTVGNLPLKSLDNKGRFEKGTIYFSSINTFKGLEIDIVFILDCQYIEPSLRKRVIYTEASRAKHKLYTYEITNPNL